MKIVIPGGSGQVGTILARAFHADDHEVTVLSRTPSSAPWQTEIWDGINLGPWVETFEGADVVVNMAGYTVNCRYTPANRSRIMNSRVDSTRVIGQAIQACTDPPHLWLQSSTATIYAHRYDAPNDETAGILGGTEDDVPDTWKFSIDVATAWEKAADAFELPETRIVKMRSAMIMSPDSGGIFDVILGLVRKGLGGRAGDGRQFVSWIHYQDFVRAVYWLIENGAVAGIVNLASPNPLPYADFLSGIRQAWGIPIGLPATKWMLEIGAFFMRTETELVLKSRRVVPGLLLEQGFEFQYPDWTKALENLVAEWRSL
ncbi:MAG: TIGR01777 family protein [Chloroflexi bacterium]|nr:MAG: TIGR01777 family protein [Chloroflexota bacterium]MBL1197164.1 TIGR01777 family protein [Chloroflexota bacterium]NOH14458.1 TIGR01777 family protein [Chloroflexota bacterium]